MTNGETNRPAPGESGVVTFDADRVIRRLVIVCVSLELLTVFLDATVNYMHWTDSGPIRRLVNITREDAIGSWLAVTQVALVALTLWLIWALAPRGQASAWTRRGWLVLAVFFSYMSVDDGSKLHERVGSAFGHASEGAQGDSGGLFGLFPSYDWQVVFLPLFGFMGLFVLYFLWREFPAKRERILVLVSIGLYIFAVFLDFIEGLDEAHRWNLYTHITGMIDMESFTRETFDKKPFVALRHFSKSIEEFAEMFGTTLLWALFLSRLFNDANGLRLRVLRSR